MKLINEDVQNKTVGSTFSFTLHLGDNSFLKVGSDLRVSHNADEKEIKEALETWKKVFWAQVDEVFNTLENLKTRLNETAE